MTGPQWDPSTIVRLVVRTDARRGRAATDEVLAWAQGGPYPSWLAPGFHHHSTTYHDVADDPDALGPIAEVEIARLMPEAP